MRYPDSHYLIDTSEHLPLEKRLAPTVAQLLCPEGGNDPRACIDFCSRDHTMLRALSAVMPATCYVGVDQDAKNHPYEIWGIGAPGSEEPCIPLENSDARIQDPSLPAYGTALIRDVFSTPDLYRSIDGLCGDVPRVVYCRPPANVPRTRFRHSIDDARRLVERVFDDANDLDFYAVEWYFAAACVMTMGKRGRAVMQVPSRLLNLSKCENDRKRFISAGLVERVVQLPAALSQGEEGALDTLIVFSHGNHERIALIDARDAGEAGGEAFCANGKATGAGIKAAGAQNGSPDVDDRSVGARGDTSDADSKEQAIRKRANVAESTARLLRACADTEVGDTDIPALSWLDIRTMESDSWSLAPFGPRSSHALVTSVALGECFTVTRGVPRSAIVNLPDWIVPPADQIIGPAPYMYLSAGAFEDGSHIKVDDLVRLIKDDDVYNLSDLEAAEARGEVCGLKKLKLLDAFVPNVLITRSGTPFKVVMIDPAADYWDEELGFVPSEWNFRYAVLPDSMLCLTPRIPDGTSAHAKALGNSPSDPICLPEYLLAYLSSHEGQRLLKATAHGATISQLSVGDVKRMRIPVPSLDMQRRIARRFAERQRRYEQAVRDLGTAAEDKRAIWPFDTPPTEV